MFGLANNTIVPAPIRRRLGKGRQLCQLADGRWLILRNERYCIGSEPVPSETALIWLIDACKRSLGLGSELQGVLPAGDWELIDNAIYEDAVDSWIGPHTTYLVEMLTASTPPMGDWDFQYELIHRAALSPDLSDEFLERKIPLLHGLYWHPCFGEAFRTYRPRISPLKRWRIVTELAGSDVRTPAPERYLEERFVWAHSKQRISQEAAHNYQVLLIAESWPLLGKKGP